MNRPNKEHFNRDTKWTMRVYIMLLEKYCDELEKAIDLACGYLTYLEYLALNVGENITTKEEWKEWLFEDE